MYRNRRHGIRIYRNKNPLMLLLWMIGAGLLYLFHHYWLVLLVLIGIIIISTIIWKTLQDVPEIENQPDHPNYQGVVREIKNRPLQTVINTQRNINNPAKNEIRTSLPSNCSRCGAPVRADEVKLTSSFSAACPYCGSTLEKG